MKSYAIHVTQTPGRCRWCRCTEAEACEGGCSWANRDRTLCSACVPLDTALRNATGRLELAVFLQVSRFKP